jgi:hypothetical protein
MEEEPVYVCVYVTEFFITLPASILCSVDDRMIIDELKGSGLGLIVVLSRCLSGGELLKPSSGLAVFRLGFETSTSRVQV